MDKHDVGRREMKADLVIETPSSSGFLESIQQSYLQYVEEFPDFQQSTRSNSYGLAISGSYTAVNADFWRDAAEYLQIQHALIELHFVLINNSHVQLTNAKLEILVEPLSGQDIAIFEGNDIPDEPKHKRKIPHVNLPKMLSYRDRKLVVDESSVCYQVWHRATR